jgi:signal transduction histidine kinase
MLGLLQRASNMLIGDQDKNMRGILQVFLMETCQAANARYLAVVLINNDGQIEDIVYSSDEGSIDIVQPRLNGHSVQIWRTRESRVIPDTEKFEDDIPLHPLITTFSVRSALGIPWIANGTVIGVVWLYYDTPQNFPLFEVRSIRAHFDQAAFIYQNSILIKEQYRQREGMFTTLAHEIGIPLVSLASTANALKAEVGDSINKGIVQMAGKIIEQSRKLELQNETILAMYGRQNRPVVLKKHSIYLPIIKACELFEDTASLRGCEIKPARALNGSFPTIEMSAHHLILAFQNLISNAVKYSYSVKAGVEAERYITILGDWSDSIQTMYTIKIQNYGVGIAPDEISSKRIFQPFERGRYSGDKGRPGKGLGLALVWQVVVVIHNGNIQVTSRPVPGGAFLTTFAITLPLRQPEGKHLRDVAP